MGVAGGRLAAPVPEPAVVEGSTPVVDRRAMSSAAELSSAASTLDQLVERIGRSADAFVGGPDEDLSLGLMEVERSLRSASRRLERLVRELRERA